MCVLVCVYEHDEQQTILDFKLLRRQNLAGYSAGKKYNIFS